MWKRASVLLDTGNPNKIIVAVSEIISVVTNAYRTPVGGGT